MNTDFTKDHFMRNRKGPIKIYTRSRMDLINTSSQYCVLGLVIPVHNMICTIAHDCTHLVSGGIHSTFPEILIWSATEQVTRK